MKIVDLKEFLKLPEGTIYYRFEPDECVFDELCIKGKDERGVEEFNQFDYQYVSLSIPNLAACTENEEVGPVDFLQGKVNDQSSFGLDFHTPDDYFIDQSSMDEKYFAVFEQDDISECICLFRNAYAIAEPPSTDEVAEQCRADYCERVAQYVEKTGRAPTKEEQQEMHRQAYGDDHSTDNPTGPAIKYDKARAYLNDLIAVGKRHGFSLSHEDGHGGFQVALPSLRNQEWLMGAYLALPKPVEVEPLTLIDDTQWKSLADQQKFMAAVRVLDAMYKCGEVKAKAAVNKYCIEKAMR
jgi:hypothetical protein